MRRAARWLGRIGPRATPSDAAEPGQEATSHQSQPEWRIRSGAVGHVKIGRPLPADLPTSDLERHYIADGLLWEGFHYDDPPLTVGIGSRPLATSSGGDPKIDRLGPNPAETAQRRGPVVAIRVHGPGPVTETGIGVGSTLAMLRRAYPDLSVHPIPPTLVDDTGVATTRVLEGVSFVFPSCAAAERGATIKRIDLWQ